MLLIVGHFFDLSSSTFLLSTGNIKVTEERTTKKSSSNIYNKEQLDYIDGQTSPSLSLSFLFTINYYRKKNVYIVNYSTFYLDTAQ